MKWLDSIKDLYQSKVVDNYAAMIVKIIIAASKKFVQNPHDFDTAIYFHQDEDPETLVLDKEYHAYGDTIETGFRWNGSSSPNSPLIRWLVPKFYKSMKRSCVHDWLCDKAKNGHDRLVADIKFFLLSVFAERESPTKCLAGLIGVRVGAYFKIGSNY